MLASLADLDLGSCHTLAKNEGTYTILSKIPTLTKLSLESCDMETLPEGASSPSLKCGLTVPPPAFRRLRNAGQPADAGYE